MNIEIDLEGIIDTILGIITDESFLVISALVCMALAVIFLLSNRTIMSRLYVLIAGANLTIQGINYLGLV